MPPARDDFDATSLQTAVDRTQPAWAKRGDATAPAAAARLVAAVEQGGDVAAVVGSAYRVWKVRAPVLMTAYYEPELLVRAHPDDTFRFPVYARPDDVASAPSRAEIEAGALAGRGLELAWTNDPLGLFLLHVQGSGRMRYEDGRIVPVLFAGTNGQPYRALGAVLVDEGLLTTSAATVPGIRRVMATLPPERQAALMARNPRYTFFRVATTEPIGSLGVELTAGRSIAADPTLIPPGSIAYLVTGSIRRFVIAQDTGAAITGAHVDLFVGPGAQAEAFAGQARERGTLYLLRPR